MVEQIIKQYNINKTNRKGLRFEGNTPENEFEGYNTKAKLYNYDFQNVTNIVAVPDNKNNNYIVVYSNEDIELDNSKVNCGLFQSTEFGSIDFKNTNTSNVTNMHDMFFNCSAELIHLDSFDTKKVTNMKWMFNKCGSKELNLRSFNTNKCTNMEAMFQDCAAKVIYF